MSEQNPGRAVLTYNLDEEYQIRIENPEEFHQSYFKDVYSQASKAVTGIVKQRNGQKEDNNPFLKEKKEFNNIVAFVGGRGTGKTSCMVSFAKYLIGKKDEKDKLDNFEIDELSKYKFVSLPTIDPSLFEKEENIIEVVLAQMFSDFESILEKSQREIDQDIRRKLIERFDVVYRNLQTIIKGRKNYDGESLETLSKLAKSTNLRDNFKKLVHDFTKLKAKPDNGRNSNEDAFLVIPIDDFDLNVKAAAEMSEQIRKYFMISNVIILMSVNMEQLRDAKELSIRQDFKGMENFMKENPAQMAVEYLLKLIPDNRRYYMPEIKIHVKETNIRIKKKNENRSEYEFINKGKLESYIFNTIFSKTGLIFLGKNDKRHILTQSTLRRLTEFVFFIEKKLIEIDACQNDKKYIQHAKESNLSILENYLIDTYIPSVISNTYLDNFNHIVKTDIQKVNYTTLICFYNVVKNKVLKFRPELFTLEFSDKLFPTNNGDSLYYDEELSELLNISNNPYNISLGDVLFMINESEKIMNDNEFTIFSDCIRLYYSIIILKAKNDYNTTNIMAICGDSLLPNENLFKVVPVKEFYYKNNNNKKICLSRTSFHLDLDKHEEIIKYINNDIFKIFTIYSGRHYLTRRRSVKILNDRYNLNSNRNFTLDVFSIILNIFYHRKELNVNKEVFDFVPFHSIDIIEESLYKYFSFNSNSKSLYDDIIEIFKNLVIRINDLTSDYQSINKSLYNPHRYYYIYVGLLKKNKFKEFIGVLDKILQNQCNELFSDLPDNIIESFESYIEDSRESGQSVDAFLFYNDRFIKKIAKIVDNDSLFEKIVYQMKSAVKRNPSITMKEFIRKNNLVIRSHINELAIKYKI